MPIITSDIVFKLSGGAANADPLAALGGAKSSVSVTNNVLNNLFVTANGAEMTAGSVKYACIYIHNANATVSMTAGLLWLALNTPSADTTIDIGLGTSAVNGTEQTIANADTAPTGITFSAPSTSGTGISVAGIPAGQHKAVWIRRTITAGASVFTSDGCTLSYQCASG